MIRRRIGVYAEAVPSDGIEINVIGGYRTGGIIVLLCSLGMDVLFATAPHHHANPPSPIPYMLPWLVPAILGLYLIFAVSRIRFLPGGEQAIFEKGVGPFVSQRTEDVSGEKRFLIRAYESPKGGRYIKVDLELADGRRFPVLRNVSSWRFDAFAESAPSIGAPLLMANPTGPIPSWFRSRIPKFRIQQSS